jgi:periplasmic protein TonB
MFDKLIDSAPTRRKRRFLGFFFGTSLLYLFAITAALVISVLVTDPQLAHTSDLKVTSLVPPPKRGESETAPRQEQQRRPAQPDIYHPAPLDTPIDRSPEEPTPGRSNNPPTGALITGPGDPNGVDRGDPNSPGFVPGTDRRDLPPDTTEPPPPPPPAQTTRQPRNDDQSPMKVPSTVLQGKAIERRTPAYPRLAITARIEGPVSVEIIISPEGRVEVARAVSGHPLLKPAAVEAARAWRFQPTLLNGIPVRVTGIITFVFKLD